MKKNKYIKLLRFSLQYLNRYKISVFFSIIFHLLFRICELYIPILLQRFIDSVVINNDFSQIRPIILSALLAFTASVAFYVFSKKLELYYVELSTRDVQWEVFSKTRKLGLEYYEKTSNGELISLLSNNVISMYFFYQNTIPKFIELAIVAIVLVPILLFSTSILMVAFICISYILVIWINFYVESKVHHIGQSQAKSEMDFNKNSFECVEGIEIIKAYDAYQWNLNRLLNAFKEYKNSVLRLLYISNMKSFVATVLKIVGLLLLLYSSVIQISETSSKIGILVSNLLYVTLAFENLEALDSCIISLNESIFNIEKVYDFCNIEIKGKKQLTSTRNSKSKKLSIEVKNLSFRFDSSEEDVIHNLNVNILKGEKIAVVGESGSGKSTLLKLLANCYENYTGEIYIQGENIRFVSDEVIRDKLTVVPQEPYIFSSNLVENILLNDDIKSNKDDIKDVMKIACIDKERLASIEEITNRGENLSGGEKQRIGIARGLVRKSSIYLFDEVTSHLDYLTEKKIIMNLLSMPETMVFVTHRTKILEQMDRILVIEKGSLVESGSYYHLMNENGRLKKMIKEGVVSEDYEKND